MFSYFFAIYGCESAYVKDDCSMENHDNSLYFIFNISSFILCFYINYMCIFFLNYYILY